MDTNKTVDCGPWTVAGWLRRLRRLLGEAKEDEGIISRNSVSALGWFYSSGAGRGWT